MIFSSPEFIFVFLPVVIAIYFILTRWHMVTLSRLWLVAASSYFYSYVSTPYLLLLYTSLGINYLIGCNLRTTIKNDQKFAKIPKRKFLLIAGITVNVCFLCYFKYADFLISNVNLLTKSNFSYLNLVLPLAISFYTFQQISFLIDSYHSEKEESDFLNYCLYVMFFPQLIAGPILRYWEIAPQFNEPGNRKLNWSNIASGLYVFGIGLFKKVVIADSFATFANAGFNTGKSLSFLEAWSTSLSYTFQIYYDFSGYSDMAIGVALIVSIRLPVNFNSPYKALNIQDFWQRWHITLSRWLRDYLYIPFGGNRKGYTRTLINLLMTFFIAGLWHGAGWTFIIWGILHGLAMVIHRLWGKCNIILPHTISWFCTFIFINIAWVFFRASSLPEAYRVLQGMFSFNLITPAFITNLLSFNSYSDIIAVLALNGPVLVTIHSSIFIVVFPVIAFFSPNAMQLIKFVPYRGKLVFSKNLKTVFFLASILFISFLTFVGDVSQGNFIYFNF